MNDLSPTIAVLREVTTPGQYRREFEIFGYVPENVLLFAEDSGNRSRNARLDVGILRAKTVKVEFYRLCDKKNWSCGVQNKYKQVAFSQLFQMIRWVDFFLFTQTNVRLKKKSSYHLDVDYDFGDEIDEATLRRELMNRFGWFIAFPAVILVWKFDKKGKGYEGSDEFAFTRPPFIFLEDDANDLAGMAHVLAHEIAH